MLFSFVLGVVNLQHNNFENMENKIWNHNKWFWL